MVPAVGGGGSGNWHEWHPAPNANWATGGLPGRSESGQRHSGFGPEFRLAILDSRFDSRFPTMADAHYITSTLADLVRTRSINPAFADGEPSDEREIATRLGTMMRALGMETTEYEPRTGTRQRRRPAARHRRRALAHAVRPHRHRRRRRNARAVLGHRARRQALRSRQLRHEGRRDRVSRGRESAARCRRGASRRRAHRVRGR